MVFSSAIFLFVFFPLVILVYYIVKSRARNAFLFIASLIFYFWGENFRAWIIIVSILMNFTFALRIYQTKDDSIINFADLFTLNARKVVLVIAVVCNLSFLSYYKYANFFVTDILGGISLLQVTLPLGISFFTLQAMSYVIDVYNKKVKPTFSLIDFGCYVSSFPQLIAGPIVRYRDIAGQLKERKASFEQFLSGLERFVVGLGKKVLIANTVAGSADIIFALPASELTPLLAWGGALCYTIQIYFDFSGYTDMAIGLGRMFGFKFRENFNYPYISRSIQDFWRRWHMSLSTWFRDYLYIPLGGGRVAPWRVYLNLWTVFLLCGLWHGASWNFIIWGGYHGLFLSLERGLWGLKLKQTPKVVAHIYVLLVVIVGWIVFRCEDIAHIITYLKSCIGLNSAESVYEDGYYFPLDVQLALCLGILLSIPVKHIITTRMLADHLEPLRYAALAAILLVSSSSVVSGNYNPFLYFRF